ncbi:amino acid adenylation domain-containing protein [Cylindrospermum sp. NIES-4074]|nr:amino acid adenylation domain-containing protein [Cylindrospermum sp. NIES-4074]
MKNIENISLESCSKNENFWRDMLRGFSVPLKLPNIINSSSSPLSRGSQEIRLSRGKTSALRTFAQNYQLSLHTLIQGAWALLLSHYSRETDILFGATRATDEDRFANTVPIRVLVDADALVLPWLKELQAQWVAVGDDESTPLAQIREWSEVPQGLPLFETVVIVDAEFQGQERNRKNRKSELLASGEYALVLWVDVESDLLLEIHYERNRFADEAIARMLGHLETLLAGIISQSEQSLVNLPLLTATERHQLLVEWNQTQVDYPKTLCIHQLFAQQVEMMPDAIALVLAGQKLTYRQLDQSANQLAHHLQKLGVSPDTLVGLCLERSLELIIALLGILKAGGAYLPLDPAYPPQRLATILDDAQCPVLLTQQKWLSHLPNSVKSHSQVICLDTDWEMIQSASTEPPHSNVTADNLAYVMYTSGSTGKPKGVCVPHRGVVRLVKGADYAQFGPEQVFLHLAAIAFDASTLEVWGPLLNGGRLVLMPGTNPSLEALGQAIREHQVTTIWLTAGLFHLMVDERLQELQPLTQILAGGDVLSVPHVQKVLQELPGCQLINGYGPTENTTFTCCYPIPRDIPITESIPIGRPIANTQVYILNQYLQPVPIGVPGELYIGGDGLARGYLHQPELTAERFIPNPFSSELGSRLYKTGDRVRWLLDGTIEFLGRIDFQVKIRGFRIEPGEIEAVLLQHPAVRSAVVMAREDRPGDKRLVAYVTTNLTPIELRRFLQQQLPSYMVPSAFLVLEQLPLNANGKVDRQALPAPDHIRLGVDRDFMPPRTPIEENLAKIWTDVLGMEVGIYDSFSELGGHSLHSTQIVSRVRDSFGVDLPVYAVLQASTIAEMSLRIASASQQQEPNKNVLSLQPVTHSNELPLSLYQERMWLLDQRSGLSPIYNLPLAFRLQGTLQILALEQAINNIIQRHSSLRTTFPIVQGFPVQRIAPELYISIPIQQVQSVTENQRLVDEEASRPFDLTQDPPIRVKLLQLSTNDHVLLITIHHIVADGWSLGIFTQELSVLYKAYTQGYPSPFTPLLIEYSDFSLCHRQWLQQPQVYHPLVAYWSRQLADAPPLLELPSVSEARRRHRPRTKLQSFSGRTQSWQIDSDLTQQLKSLSRKSGSTLFMTLLTAFVILLYRYSRQEDIVIGSPLANRNRTELEAIIGCFSNIVPIRTNLAGNPPFLELLKQVQQTTLEAYTYQEFPVEQLLPTLQSARDLSYSPWFQVVFNLLNVPMSNLEMAGLNVQQLAMQKGAAIFDLMLLMWETDAGLSGTVEYNTELFDESTIKQFIQHFQTLLQGIVANSNQQILTLPLLTEVEKNWLLLQGANTQTDYPQTACIHQLFEQQVKRTPAAIAVVFEHQQLTYQELNIRANQLAHHLQKLGVGTETFVGICLERSLDLLIGLLGILKAGAAYVPLDPAYPQQRLEFMLCDAAVPFLLTQTKLVEKLPKHKAHLVCLDTDWQIINRENPENPTINLKSTNLAYILYTSGSTGQPKGVAIEHTSTVNFINWALKTFNSQQLAGVLAATSICFDLSVFELFATLSCGGKVILAENILHLPTLKAAKDVTLINTVPSAIAELLKANALPPGVHTVNLAGEALSNQLVQQLYQQSTIKQVFNLYGPSEATTYSTFTLCLHNSSNHEKISASASIGRPIDNTQIYILDSQLQPVPVGVPGELHIGGCGLAQGYLNRPDLTTEKFISNPFINSKSARLYKTGDLARYLPDGNIEYLGRMDNQVKIRGLRIELLEIEAVLAKHPSVQQTAVTISKDELGNKRLIAYTVLQPKQTLSTDELRCFLKQKLPDYMIPNSFAFLDTLPLNPNGKLDRRALSAIDFTREVTKTTPLTSLNELELQLIQIWEQVLGVTPIDVHDNFFDLGGHSLLALRLFVEIENNLGKNLPLATMFQVSTIAQLASVIRNSAPPKFLTSPDFPSLDREDYGKLIAIVAGRQGKKNRPESLIVTLNHHGVKQPFFFCATSFEDVIPLAKHLGTEQPICFMESGYSVFMHKASEQNIKAIAAYHVHDLLTLQPAGDYVLGGYSFGGLIAYEVAKQLESHGRKVSTLIIVDYPAAASISYHITRFLAIYYIKKFPLRLSEIKEFFSNEKNRQKVILSIFQKPYIMQGYSGKIHLFLASEFMFLSDRLMRFIFPRFGWKKQTVEKLYQIPGNHQTALKEPYVKVLADDLTFLLTKQGE